MAMSTTDRGDGLQYCFGQELQQFFKSQWACGWPSPLAILTRHRSRQQLHSRNSQNLYSPPLQS